MESCTSCEQLYDVNVLYYILLARLVQVLLLRHLVIEELQLHIPERFRDLAIVLQDVLSVGTSIVLEDVLDEGIKCHANLLC